MDNLEFAFDDGGKLYFEYQSDGSLLIRIQASHPGDGWKITSSTAILDKEQAIQVKNLLEGKNELA